MFQLIFSLLFLINLSTAYDNHLIHTAVNISQAAYCMTQTSMWDCITCDTTNSYDNILIQNAEQVIFGYNEEYESIFVSFRGSDTSRIGWQIFKYHKQHHIRKQILR